MSRSGEDTRELQQLLDRVHERTDLAPKSMWKAALVIVLIWAVAAGLNFFVFGKAVQPEKDRAKLAVFYGPLYQPLKIAEKQRRRAPFEVGKFKLQLELVGILPFGLAAAVAFFLTMPPSRTRVKKLAAQRMAEREGRLALGTIARRLGLKGPGVPLGIVKGQVLGIPHGADKGHVVVVAPTRSGKGLHATETLLRWPGPTVVVDPKNELVERTAGYRSSLTEQMPLFENDHPVGKVYRIPEPHGIDLLAYYNIHDPLDLQELANHLLRPWTDNQPIFAEKALALFEAARDVAKATGGHMLKILAQWSQGSPVLVLEEARKHAPAAVAKFIDGNDLGKFEQNRFAQNAWGTFTTRFGPFVPHIRSMTEMRVPATWAEENATIFLCYPMDQLSAAGPLVSAIIAGLIKGRLKQRERVPTLFLIDELPTVALGNLDTYLATAGGYGVTMLAYIQSLAQLRSVYGRDKAEAILGNFNHQIFYAPREHESAEYISRMFGEELLVDVHERVSQASDGHGGTKQVTHYDLHERRGVALTPAQVMALPEAGTVVFSNLAGRQYRFLAQRMNPFGKGGLPALPAFVGFPYDHGLYDERGKLLVRRISEAERRAMLDAPAGNPPTPGRSDEPPPRLDAGDEVLF